MSKTVDGNKVTGKSHGKVRVWHKKKVTETKLQKIMSQSNLLKLSV